MTSASKESTEILTYEIQGLLLVSCALTYLKTLKITSLVAVSTLRFIQSNDARDDEAVKMWKILKNMDRKPVEPFSPL